jgi:hypothetical protein
MYRQFAALLVSCLASLNAMATDYNGFQIDEHLLDAGQRAAFSGAPATSVIEQLKIVESVGLPPAVLEGLKKTRINVDPDLRGQPGIFNVRQGEGAVWIRPIVFPANKPILLHELLHAYHYNVLTMRNREVQGAYERAKSDGQFPAAWQSSHFLENAKEYFAVTGTLYLFGDIQQPPFRCTELAKLGADYLAFLAAQFGPHECHGGAVQGQLLK